MHILGHVHTEVYTFDGKRNTERLKLRHGLMSKSHSTESYTFCVPAEELLQKVRPTDRIPILKSQMYRNYQMATNIFARCIKCSWIYAEGFKREPTWSPKRFPDVISSPDLHVFSDGEMQLALRMARNRNSEYTFVQCAGSWLLSLHPAASVTMFD